MNPPATLHDGCSISGPRFRVGLARTLSPGGRATQTDTFARSTQATRGGSARDYHRLAPLGFPDPGCLAGARPSIDGRSTSLLFREGDSLWHQQFTRLALQLFLVKGFKLYSFQLQDPKEPCISIYCHYLPVSGLGNLRACCLPWMW